MSRGRVPFFVVLALLCAFLVAGCSRTVDAAALGDQIGKAISQEQGGKKTAVKCPDDVEEKSGATFVCAMTVGVGTALQRANVNVTLTGKSRFSYVVVAG